MIKMAFTMKWMVGKIWFSVPSSMNEIGGEFLFNVSTQLGLKIDKYSKQQGCLDCAAAPTNKKSCSD